MKDPRLALNHISSLIEKEITRTPGNYATSMTDAWRAVEVFINKREYAHVRLSAERAYYNGHYCSLQFAENDLTRNPSHVCVWGSTPELAICIAMLVGVGYDEAKLAATFDGIEDHGFFMKWRYNIGYDEQGVDVQVQRVAE